MDVRRRKEVGVRSALHGQTDGHSDLCVCDICKNQRPFKLSEELYEKFLHGEVVIFAGAGVSSENEQVFPYSFYEDVCEELGIKPDKALSFPDLMTRYCAQPNGRAKLLRKVKDRFDYIRSFPELYRVATKVSQGAGHDPRYREHHHH